MRNHIMRFFWIFIGIIVSVVVTSVVFNAIFVHNYYPAGSYPYYGMMGFWGGYGPFWGFGALMMLIPLALLVLFVLWIVGVAQNHNGHEHFGWHDDDALEVLNRRYANGSITQEEYNRIREEITKK